MISKNQLGFARIGLMVCMLVGLVVAGCRPTVAPTATPTAPPAPTEVATVPPTATPLPPATEVVEGPVSGGELVIGFGEAAHTFDPHAIQTRSVARVLLTVCEPLIVRGPDRNFHPSLAESWDISPEGKAYTFVLRKDVKFHDGTPFNAQTVKYNLDRIASPEEMMLSKELLGPYESTEVVDDYTVIVHLEEPFAPLLDGLSKVYTCIMSPTAVEKWGEEVGVHVVGTGPFIAEEIVPDDHVTLVKNPDYNWAPPFYKHQGPAYLDKVTFKFIPEESTRLATLETGEVDIVDALGGESVKIVDADPNLRIGKAPYGGTPRSLWLNTQRPPTDSLAVRRAIEYAIDRQEIIDTIYGGLYEPGIAPLTRATWSHNPNVGFPFDPDKVKEILTEDGWTQTEDGMWEKNGAPLHLLYYNLGGYGLTELAEMLQGQLIRAGFDVEIRSLALGAWLSAVGEGLHNICPTMGDATDPTILRSMFGEETIETSLNRSKVRGDTELETLLKEQDRESDPAKRKQLVERVQEILMEKAYIVPLYDSVETYGYSAKIQDLTFDPATHPFLYDVWIKP